MTDFNELKRIAQMSYEQQRDIFGRKDSTDSVDKTLLADHCWICHETKTTSGCKCDRERILNGTEKTTKY